MFPAGLQEVTRRLGESIAGEGVGEPGHLVPKHIPPMALRGTLLYLRMVQLQTEGQTPMDSWSVPPPQEELNFDTLRLPRFLAL